MDSSVLVLIAGFGVVSTEDLGMLGQKTFLLLLDNTAHSRFFGDLGIALVKLQLALGLVDYKFFLPETLDLVLVF